MVYVPLSVVRDYMENKWRKMGGKPKTRREQNSEILLKWYIWLGFYPTDPKALWEFNIQLAEYYSGDFTAEVRKYRGIPKWGRR